MDLSAAVSIFDDLHVFNTATRIWQELTSQVVGMIRPSARAFHGYTAERGYLFIHGGSNSETGTTFNDVWVFNPSTKKWTNRTNPGAKQRTYLGLTSSEGRIYAHGGMEGDPPQGQSAVLLKDLYVIDTDTWTTLTDPMEVSGTPPSPREGHGFTSVGDMLFVHGGGETCGSEILQTCLQPVLNPIVGDAFDTVPIGDLFDDFLSFDLSQLVWTNKKFQNSTRPSPRREHGFTSLGSRLYVFGGMGYGGSLLNDLLEFKADETGVWSWRNLTARGPWPSPRKNHGFATANGKLYVHGGSGAGGKSLNDLFEFDLDPESMTTTTTNLRGVQQGAIPSSRACHGFSSLLGKLYVHGGSDLQGSILRDLLVFDPITRQWTNLSSTASGVWPSPRKCHGFTSEGERLYLFGGSGTAGENLNDFFVFDPTTFTWAQFSADENRPAARQYHGFAAAGGKLFVHGGSSVCLGDNDVLNMMYIVSIKQVPWAEGESWLVNVYDWDEIIVDASTKAELSFVLDLCIDDYPCYAHIKGKDGGRVAQVNGGSISCTTNNGCKGLVLQSVQIECNASGIGLDGPVVQIFGSNVTVINSSFSTCSSRDGIIKAYDGAHAQISASAFVDMNSNALKIRRSSLTILNSSFTDCSSTTDGGAIHISDHSQLKLHLVTFENVHSYGNGGAISVHSSNLSMENSSFLSTSSDMGGGAVWVSYQDVYGREISDTSEMRIEVKSCFFQRCSSKADGGAVLIELPEVHNIHYKINIIKSEFGLCTSESGGGAIFASGSAVMVSLNESSFKSCNALATGGAIAASCTLSVTKSTFLNCASNMGGGAISSSNARNRHNIDLLESEFSGCISRFGGAIYLSGSSVSARIKDSKFKHCTASATGGVVSVHDSAQLAAHSSTFFDNSALGLGGGVFDFKNARIAIYNLSCSGNKALAGGGGVLLWQGSVYPSTLIPCPTGTSQATEKCMMTADVEYEQTSTPCPGTFSMDSVAVCVISMWSAVLSASPIQKNYNCSWLACKTDTAMTDNFCGDNNNAMYGPCIASDFKNLLVPQTRTLAVYPGVTFAVLAIKKDAYNQTIASDSSNTVFLQYREGVDASLPNNNPQNFVKGIATFPGTAITPFIERIDVQSGQPIIENYPWMFTYIIDNDVQPPVIVSMPFYIGFRPEICPLGSILVLSQGLSGIASCVPCSTGTYSINPMANAANSTQEKPSCLICPKGSVCVNGLIQNGTCETNYFWKDPGCQLCATCNQYVSKCGPFTDSLCAVDNTKNNAMIASVVCVVGCLFLAGAAIWYLNKKRTGASRRLLKEKCDVGSAANQEDLPWELRHKFEAVKCIGFGRSSVILEATDKLQSRSAFAIKLVFPKEEFFSAEDLIKLDREAEILSKVQSSSIVQYKEHGKSKKDDVYWVVMERLQGKSLDKLFGELKKCPLPEVEVIKIGIEMCFALHALHSVGIINRDLNPSNIFQIQTEAVSVCQSMPEKSYKLIDLGSSVYLRHTTTNSSNGEDFPADPSYSSPEMLDYLTSPEQISAASDLWSLCACLFHLVTGQLPFESSTLALARKNILNTEYLRPDIREKAPGRIQDSVTILFAAVIGKGLEKAPEKRFCTALDLAMALQKCLVQQGSSVYSLYISFCGPSDMIHALLLQNMMNCKTTERGGKIFVYMRPIKPGHEDNFEELSHCLMNSLVAVPILSSSMLDSMSALKGSEEDKQNRTLLELTLMQALQASSQSALKRIFPVLNESIVCPKTNIENLVPRQSPLIVRAAHRVLSAHGILMSKELLNIVQKSVKASISDIFSMLDTQVRDAAQKEHATQHGNEALIDDNSKYYELLKTSVSQERLPPKHEICSLVSKLKFVVQDICSVLDEVQSNVCQGQEQVDSSVGLSQQAGRIFFVDQLSIGRHEIVYATAGDQMICQLPSSSESSNDMNLHAPA